MSALGVERQGDVAVVVLDRPPVNAVDHAALLEISEVFVGLADDPSVRAVIFTGAGDRAFMAGLDLRAEAPVPADPSDPGRVARDAMAAIVECPVPVIGAINGPALGAGLAFAACCDILLAAHGATFATPEINVGLLGASAHLSRLVGRHKARELFFTGEAISAEELLRLGALRAVVLRSELMEESMALATELASKSPVALRLAKASMNEIEDMGMLEGYRVEQGYTARLATSEDAKEARAAFLEKRPPRWTGR
jgi:enoyl-CoA hydratase